MAFNRTTPAVAEALVREYLTKHGLHDSIKAFELEQPRTATSISSRSALRQSLGLERTPAKLKRLLPDLELPRTTLELWVEYQLQKLAGHDGCKLAVPEKLFSSTSAPMHKEHLIPAMPSLRLRDLPGSHGSGATRPLTAADLGGTADGIVRGSSGSYTSRPLTTRPLTADGLSLGDKPISMGSASTGGRQGAVSAHGLTHSARTSPVAETEPAMAVAPADALPITTLVLSVAADLSASEERVSDSLAEADRQLADTADSGTNRTACQRVTRKQHGQLADTADSGASSTTGAQPTQPQHCQGPDTADSSANRTMCQRATVQQHGQAVNVAGGCDPSTTAQTPAQPQPCQPDASCSSAAQTDVEPQQPAGVEPASLLPTLSRRGLLASLDPLLTPTAVPAPLPLNSSLARPLEGTHPAADSFRHSANSGAKSATSQGALRHSANDSARLAAASEGSAASQRTAAWVDSTSSNRSPRTAAAATAAEEDTAASHHDPPSDTPSRTEPPSTAASLSGAASPDQPEPAHPTRHERTVASAWAADTPPQPASAALEQETEAAQGGRLPLSVRHEATLERCGQGSGQGWFDKAHSDVDAARPVQRHDQSGSAPTGSSSKAPAQWEQEHDSGSVTAWGLRPARPAVASSVAEGQGVGSSAAAVGVEASLHPAGATLAGRQLVPAAALAAAAVDTAGGPTSADTVPPTTQPPGRKQQVAVHDVTTKQSQRGWDPVSPSGHDFASSPPATPALAARTPQGAELVIEDLEGDLGHDLGVCHTAVVRAVVEQQTHIPAEEMRSMRQLLFGRKCGPGLPWGAWKQGLFFNTTPGLTFGLVQKQGGPCGVLAAMQAHVLAALWDPVTGMHLHVDEAQQTAALCAAITAVLWQAGHQCSATLVGSSSSAATADLSFDELCRSASCRRFSSREALAEAVRALLPQYMQADGYGLLLLLFSVVLSHNVRQIQAERDEPESALIARHGYCSPDLVHLLLTGRAVANCFNGDRQLDGKVYRGISARSHLGLLTLFEHYKYVEVGSHLKSPHLPIWVVCSESHFTTLFAPSAGDGSLALSNAQGAFDLLYYDGLSNQDSAIMLTVSAKGAETKELETEHANEQLVPPLQHVIQTKWGAVEVAWHGCDPIL